MSNTKKIKLDKKDSALEASIKRAQDSFIEVDKVLADLQSRIDADSDNPSIYDLGLYNGAALVNAILRDVPVKFYEIHEKGADLKEVKDGE